MYNKLVSGNLKKLHSYANYELWGEGTVYICTLPEKLSPSEIVGREVLINENIKFIKDIREELPPMLSDEQRAHSIGLLVQE